VGEITAIAGAVAQSPHTNGGLPDYSVAAKDFIPVARLLYGIQWSGEYSTLIRFEPTQRGTNIALSTLIKQALQQTAASAAAFVILADCAGLVGAQIRRIPQLLTERQPDHFQVPQIRDWLSFSAERIHRHNLALIAGVATTCDMDQDSPLRPLIRQLDGQGDCFGHFHSAVFPYKPLKKRTLQLQDEVAELFESGALEDVLHLLHDDRSFTGAGESELLNGACWIGPINLVAEQEDMT
jgi:hypothetical protein